MSPSKPSFSVPCTFLPTSRLFHGCKSKARCVGSGLERGGYSDNIILLFPLDFLCPYVHRSGQFMVSWLLTVTCEPFSVKAFHCFNPHQANTVFFLWSCDSVWLYLLTSRLPITHLFPWPLFQLFTIFPTFGSSEKFVGNYLIFFFFFFPSCW